MAPRQATNAAGATATTRFVIMEDLAQPMRISARQGLGLGLPTERHTKPKCNACWV